MLMYKEFEAQTSTVSPVWISRGHVLASRALNMSSSYGQPARSIESKCVVFNWYFKYAFCVRQILGYKYDNPKNVNNFAMDVNFCMLSMIVCGSIEINKFGRMRFY